MSRSPRCPERGSPRAPRGISRAKCQSTAIVPRRVVDLAASVYCKPEPVPCRYLLGAPPLAEQDHGCCGG